MKVVWLWVRTPGFWLLLVVLAFLGLPFAGMVQDWRTWPQQDQAIRERHSVGSCLYSENIVHKVWIEGTANYMVSLESGVVYKIDQQTFGQLDPATHVGVVVCSTTLSLTGPDVVVFALSAEDAVRP